MKKKRYRIKPSKQQLEIMRNHWLALISAENFYWGKIQGIQESMRIQTKIEGIEFIKDSEGYWSGIGNASRTMKLYQQEELEAI